LIQANIDPAIPKGEWNLEALAAKVKQYCALLDDVTPELLAEKCPTFDSLGDYLRLRGREAYLKKKVG
jgi:preprotein translocase subunit SecA